MLEFHSSSSCAVDTRKAVTECLRNALGAANTDCDLIVFYTTMGHDFAEILGGMRRLAPHARIAGCTCTGVTAREGPSESMRALAIMAVRGPRDEIAVAGVERITQEGSREKARELALDLRRQNPAANMILFHPSGLNVFPQGAIEGIESVFGPRVPVMGGVSTDNLRLVGDFEFLDDRTFERGAVAMGLADPTIEVVTGVNHGFSVVGAPMRVTLADGNRILELDGKPAWTAWAEALGLPPTAGPWEVGIAPLVRELPQELHEEYDSRFIHLIYCGTPAGDGSIHTTQRCPEGTAVWITRRDEKGIFAGVDRMVERIVHRCRGRKPIAVLHADCNSRGKMRFNKVLKEELLSRMQGPLRGSGDVPWLGMYGGAEFAPLGGRNCAHAFTSALYVIVKRDS
jgi:hypothetical protein